MRKLIGASMFYLFASLVLSRASAADILSASSQEQSGTACLSYEPSVVELTGTILRKTFADAQDKPETYWLLELSQAICVNKDSKDPGLNYAQKDVRAVQLVLHQGMYAKYKDLVGKKVIASGPLFAGITAHHHTPLLLTVSSLRKAD